MRDPQHKAVAIVLDGVQSLMNAGDWWGAAERARLLANADPLNATHWNNHANALWLHGDPAAALAPAQRAAALAPDHPVVWRCLGNVLQDLGCFPASLEAYQRSLRLQLDPATAFNASKVQLALGDYPHGYRLAEQRLLKPGFAVYRRGPYWQGWPEARRLWLWSEQGFGDVLQYLRWVPLLLERGCSVVLELEPSLVPLVAQGLAWAVGAYGGGLSVVCRQEQPPTLPEGACQGPLLSLPTLLGAAPLRELCPYLRLPGSAQRPRRRPRLGLVWASGQFLDRHVLEREYRRKSLLGAPLQSLLNALALRPLDLVALQFGPDRPVPDWIGRFAAVLPPEADFAEQAHWLLDLDLLIAVDTAAAHLAGALGVPVWLLLPWAAEPRWQRDRADTPWYPSMRLVRQPHNDDWYGLIRLLLAHLDIWLSSRSNSSA
jgi:tetratricopeptide (TPR) repeat protein